MLGYVLRRLANFEDLAKATVGFSSRRIDELEAIADGDIRSVERPVVML